jgi:hypothetical protein
MKERSAMNNYFGIGIDAKISLDFHNKREEILSSQEVVPKITCYMGFLVVENLSKSMTLYYYIHIGRTIRL